jgi:hypothetical protein
MDKFEVKRRRKELLDAIHAEDTARVAYKTRIRSPFTDVVDPVKRMLEKRRLRAKRVRAEKWFLDAVNRRKGRK